MPRQTDEFHKMASFSLREISPFHCDKIQDIETSYCSVSMVKKISQILLKLKIWQRGSLTNIIDLSRGPIKSFRCIAVYNMSKIYILPAKQTYQVTDKYFSTSI